MFNKKYKTEIANLKIQASNATEYINLLEKDLARLLGELELDLNKNTIEVYPGIDDQWRWRLIASNSRTSAASGESFSTKSNAMRSARRLQVLLGGPEHVNFEVADD